MSKIMSEGFVWTSTKYFPNANHKKNDSALHPHGPQIPGTIHGRMSPQRLPKVAPNQNNVVIYSQRSKTTENKGSYPQFPSWSACLKTVFTASDICLTETAWGPLKSPQPFVSSGGVDGSCGPGGRSPTRWTLTLL